MSSSWVKDLGEFLADDTHILLTHRQFEDINAYEFSMPTSPSVGRVYRQGGTVVEVQAHPDPGFTLHRRRVVLFLDEAV